MNRRISLTDISTLSGRRVFFDTNVLIYIFWPTGMRPRIAEYSSAFRRLLNMKIDLCLDITVLSELINRILRLEHEKYLKENSLQKDQFGFKQFRNTPECFSSTEVLYLLVQNRILRRFVVVGKSFSNADIPALFIKGMDFNDQIIISTCLENNCILLTNDADYLNAPIDILSSNPKLLAE
ncbi:MAG: PIN domain-containing protein [archaeon]